MHIASIKAALPGAVLNDDQVRGLHLRAFPTSKAFYLFYRTKGGTQRRPRIGSWPTMTLTQARELAREMLARVARGEDPSGDFQKEKVAPTMVEVWSAYSAEHKDQRAYEGYQIQWRLYIGKRYANEKVASISFEDVRLLHRSLSTKPYQANRTLALMSVLLNYAETRGWRPLGSNPCCHVERFPEKKRRRIMSAEEALRLGLALREEEAKNPAAVAFIYLLAFTGARKGEIAAAKWSQLQGDKLVLTEHKTDRTGDDRVIHLPPQVVEILERIPRTSGAIMGIKTPRNVWIKIREKAGCPDLRIHDLRRSFASAALSDGVPLGQVGELLGHRSAQTTKGYAYLMDDAAKVAAAKAATTMAGMLGLTTGDTE